MRGAPFILVGVVMLGACGQLTSNSDTPTADAGADAPTAVDGSPGDAGGDVTASPTCDTVSFADTFDRSGGGGVKGAWSALVTIGSSAALSISSNSGTPAAPSLLATFDSTGADRSTVLQMALDPSRTCLRAHVALSLQSFQVDTGMPVLAVNFGENGDEERLQLVVQGNRLVHVGEQSLVSSNVYITHEGSLPPLTIGGGTTWTQLDLVVDLRTNTAKASIDDQLLWSGPLERPHTKPRTLVLGVVYAAPIWNGALYLDDFKLY